MIARRPLVLMAGLTAADITARFRRAAALAAENPPSVRMETTGRTTRIHLYGVIGGWFGDIDAAALVPSIRELDVDTIEIYINSPGGDAYDGIAIRNALAQHSARVVVTVDALAASAASVVVTAGDEVVMSAGSELMIHDAWIVAMGNAEDLREAADWLDRISDSCADMYAAKAGGTAAEWRKVMKTERWYTAQEAVDAGLADRLDSAGASNIVTDLRPAARVGAEQLLHPAALATNREESPMNRAQLAAALAAGTITQEQHDAALAAMDVIAAPVHAEAVLTAPEAVQAGPELQTQQPAPVTTQERPLSRMQMATRLAEAGSRLQNSHDPIAAIQMAIADIIPADDEGLAFVNREDWTGEAWRAVDDSRPWIDAFGTPGNMTTPNGRGWRWGRDAEDPEDPELAGTPEVDEYAGNKTEVPSNEIGTKPITYTPFRIAGGWDVDRIYFDFSDPEFWLAFQEAAIRDYKGKSNTGIRTRLLAAATEGATAGGADVDETAAGGGKAVLKQLIGDIRRVPGARANRIFLGSFLFGIVEDIPTADLPLWLKSADVSADTVEGQANVGQLQVRYDPGLSAKAAVVLDSRAAKIKERSPFWVKAENIPKGGIDVGVFSYLRLEVTDPRLFIKRDYA